MSTAPLFSIVVPVFNRAHTLQRCLNSVFSQRFADFEVIAVDDGSTDGSPDLLRGVVDDRLRIVVHDDNRGVCPARNTGIGASVGQWIVFLDSDDEFATDDALERMADYAGRAPHSLHALWFRSRLDDGRFAPDPIPPGGDLDYRGYIRFLEATLDQPRDMIRCVRRWCFDLVRYPDNRMLEDKFHLDFALLFRSRIHHDVLRLYHQDAGNQLVRQLGRLSRRHDRLFLADRARGLNHLLATHGATLAREAPRSHRRLQLRAARTSLRAGRVGAALGVGLRTAIDPRAWLAVSAACLLLPGRSSRATRTHA